VLEHNSDVDENENDDEDSVAEVHIDRVPSSDAGADTVERRPPFSTSTRFTCCKNTFISVCQMALGAAFGGTGTLSAVSRDTELDSYTNNALVHISTNAVPARNETRCTWEFMCDLPQDKKGNLNKLSYTLQACLRTRLTITIFARFSIHYFNFLN